MAADLRSRQPMSEYLSGATRPEKEESESFNPVHNLEQRANIVLVDGERRIVGRHTPDEVGVVVIVIATLYHAVVVGDKHIYIAMNDTFGAAHPFHTHNVAIVDFGLH